MATVGELATSEATCDDAGPARAASDVGSQVVAGSSVSQRSGGSQLSRRSTTTTQLQGRLATLQEQLAVEHTKRLDAQQQLAETVKSLEALEKVLRVRK